MAKISKLSFVLYLFLSNYIIYLYIGVPTLIMEYKNMAYFGPLLILSVSIVFVIFLPKRVINIDYFKRIKSTKIIKFILFIALLLDALLTILIAIRVLDQVFFFTYFKHFFLLTMIIIAIIASRNNGYVLISSSTILFLMAIVLILVPLFLSNSVKNYALLLPLKFYKSFKPLLILSYFVFDMFKNLLILPSVKPFKSKWFILIPLSLMLFFFTIDVMNNILIAGTFFLVDNEYLGFFTLYIQDTINYIGNLGFSYLYLIPVLSIFKASVSLSLLRELMQFKKGYLLELMLMLLYLFLAYFLTYQLSFRMIMLGFVYSLLFLYMVIYFYILINRSEKYEISI